MNKILKLVAAVALVFVIGYIAVLKLMQPSDFPPVAFEHPKAECAEHHEPLTWRSCIFQAKETSGDVLYYLHGRDLNERTWGEDTAYYTSMLQKYWQERHRKIPTVISVSFGDVWLLAQKNGAVRSGLLEIFTGTVIPILEKSLSAKPPHRLLLGESMGGINTLELVFKTKGLFERAAALCPPISDVSPYDTFQARWKFIRDSGADPRTMLGVTILARMFGNNEQDWKSMSPLDLVETADPKSAPKLYLSCGLRDKYGNYPSVEKLAARAKERGFDLQWRPVFAGHCGIDVPSVADFLVP